MILLAVIILVNLYRQPLHAAQTQNDQWTQPIRLSSLEGAFIDNSNVILADPYGQVHLFWFEGGFEDQRSILQYARFDGKYWSPPVDIYATQPGVPLGHLAAAIDPHGTVHVIWTEGGFLDGPMFYSSAQVNEPISARSWSEPRIVDGKANLIKLQIDSLGVLHLLFSKYLDSNPGVYYMRSEDLGQTWSSSTWLDPDILPGYVADSIQFAIDDADGLHAVWFYISVDEIDGDWVRYAHSLDGGDSWAKPFTIDRDDGTGRIRTAAAPRMTVQGQTVHVIWAAGDLNYRHHRISFDSGQTWQPFTRIFGQLNGQAWDAFATDGDGRVHYFAQIRYPQGIYHAYWDRARWVGPELIYLMRLNSNEDRGDRLNVHRIQSAVRLGNQLVITFHDRSDDKPYALYAMHRTLEDIPQQAIASFPELEEDSGQEVVISQEVEPPLLNPTRSVPEIQVPEPGLELSHQTPFEIGELLGLALIPAFIFLGSVTTILLLSKRQKI